MDIFGQQFSTFHVVSKLVPTLVKIYDGIFQTLEPEGDFLLKQPFLDPTPHSVQPRLGPIRLSRVLRAKKLS
jgi:hypothetical protein